jgi:hypothetical protein
MVNINHTLALAKRNQIGKAELFSRMQSIAEARRSPGESAAQSFVRFISTDEGAELFRIQKAMSGHDIESQTSAPVIKSGGGGGEWGDLITAVRKRTGLSENAAINQVLSTPEGLRLFQMAKRRQQISGDTGFTKADMQVLDDIAAEQHAWTDMRKGSPVAADVHTLSSYNELLDKARSMYPTMSESKLHDFVRARHPEAWEAHKLQKLGSGGLPRARGQRERSGEDPPTPTTGRGGRTAPQWQSDHSGSPPTTPAHAAEHPSDTPTIKMLNNIARHAGMSRYELAKHLSSSEVGRKWILMAAMERVGR